MKKESYPSKKNGSRKTRKGSHQPPQARRLDTPAFCFYGPPENDEGGYSYFGPNPYGDFPYGPHPDELRRRGPVVQNMTFVQEEEAVIQNLEFLREEEEEYDSWCNQSSSCFSSTSSSCSSAGSSCLSSGGYSYVWVGANKKYIRIDQYSCSYGCPTCGPEYIEESLGCSSEYSDAELEVLASLEAAVSSEVHYPLYQNRVRERIEKVYQIKDQLDEIENVRNEGPEPILYSEASDDEMERVRAIYSLCEASSEGIDHIKSILDEYRLNEWTATRTLNVLSCAVYKWQLQQFDSEYKTDHWKSWKQRVPARSLPAVNIILRSVVPFVLG